MTLKKLPDRQLDVLLSSNSLLVATQLLYVLAKEKNPRLSLTMLSRLLGVKSKGYVSEILSGKKRISRETAIGLMGAFKLDERSKTLWNLLASKENAASQAELVAIDEQLKIARKTLSVKFLKAKTRLQDVLFLTELFCAFGLFENRPSLAELQSYFGKRSRDELLEGLQALVEFGVVGEHTGRYVVLKDNIMFLDSDDKKAHLDFLKQALEQSTAAVEKWFDKPQQAYFEHTIISTTETDYVNFLKKLKQQHVQNVNSLESSKADLLVKVCLQAYPLRSK